MDINELSFEDLQLNILVSDFTDTSELQLFKGIIGQSIAEKYIDMGLDINKKEYNIFISGHSSTGKTSYIINKVEAYAKTLPTPMDWCYVYNFKNPHNPIAIELTPGEGKVFKNDMLELIKFISKEIQVKYSTSDYDNSQNSIIGKYEKMSLQLTDNLTSMAKEKNLSMEEDPKDGLVFIPIINDKELEPDEYSKLSKEEKEEISENVSQLRLMSLDMIKQSKIIERNMNEELDNLDNKLASESISPKILELTNKYSYNKVLCKYLSSLKEDIIENFDYFLTDKNINNETTVKDDLNARIIESYLDESFSKKYEVNLIVDNSKLTGAPVIFESSNNYYDLFGKIEYDNKMGNLTTDFTHIKAGNIHKANGGFLILNANDLVNSPIIYENLIRILKDKKITIENIKGGIEITPIISLKAQSIPLNLKVILIGSNYIYSVLLGNDPYFQKLFKIKAEFDSEIELNSKNISQLLGYIANYISIKKFLPISKDGILDIVKYGCRLSSSKLYFSSSIGKMLDIVDISNYIGKKDNALLITKEHVMAALMEQQNMHSLVKRKILKMYKDKQFLLDTNLSKVGQINGLSLSDFGDIEVGQAHRITATTYAGRKGIINIEKESKMSGNIHIKSVMILSGYIGDLLGQDTFLSFNANLVFEQLYSGIEGDSASCAELLCLLSSLSDIPIKQNLAITGSINQFGDVQPIGGVNEKVEGFYNICKSIGLNGNEGVVIPKSNVDDLVLDYEVISAIEENRFHIYTASTIEDCMKLMFDLDDETLNDIIPYIKKAALKKLNHYNEIIRRED